MAIKHLTYACIPLIAASMSSQAATVDQLNRQVQKLNQRIAAQDQRFRVNGFATFGMSQSNEAIAYNDVNDDINFNRFSKIGIQMSFNIDSQNSVVTQLVSRGENNWETSAEWAYFKHDFNNGFTGKIGRLRLPAFMLSEFLDVGYAVPWAKMPNESYSSLTPFSNMEGVDLSYNTDVGDLSATIQFAYGRSKSDDYDLKDIISVNASLQADTWNTKASYSQADVSVLSETINSVLNLYKSVPVAQVQGLDGSFTSLGFTYDPGDVYFSAEYTNLEVEGTVVDADSMHATFGYRIGRFMPTITYAVTESQDDDERDIAKILAANPYVSDTTQLATAIAGGLQAIGTIKNAIAATAGDADLAAAAAIGTNGVTVDNLNTVATNTISLVDPSVPATQTAPNIVTQQVMDGAKAAATGILSGTAAFQAEQNRNTTRIGLGMRYDMSPGTALKLQYDIIEVDGAAGMFDSETYAGATTKPDATNILTISIDTVF